MTDERWQQFVDLAREQFDEVEITTEQLEVQTEDGPQIRGSIDILEFEKGGDRFKLERENKPLVLEKKMLHAKRANDVAQIEYKFSDTEFSHKLRVYKENMSGDWEEINLGDLGL